MKIIKQNKYLKVYISILAIFSVYWLHDKSQVGNDWGVSEWIINYQGGFVRRGLPGEIAFYLAKYFGLDLRFVIFILQSLTYLFYLYSIYFFFKKTRLNLILFFAFFTPIFLFYHLAEIEVLARKEIFMFIGMIWFYEISGKNNSLTNSLLWVFFILPLITILYEPTAFYYPFFAAVIIIKTRNLNIYKTIIILITIFIPSLIAAMFSAFDHLTFEEFELMKNSIKINFGEDCLGSCNLMGSKKESLIHINKTIEKLTKDGELSMYVYLIRYFLILLIGSIPLILIIFFSKLRIKILKFNYLLYPFFLLNIFVPIHWLMFYDWGRAVNIIYVSSFLFLIYLYKNKFIEINFKKIRFLINFYLNICIKYTFLKSKKKLTIFIFLIYSFCWSPPTLLSEDVNSFPIYRLPYKTIKSISARMKNYINVKD